MPELPSGTVTFLFTDIERSTEHLAAMGNDAYADALDTHRQLLREAFKTHSGHEIATEGDSFFVAFARAQDAVAAAAAGQRALGEHPLRARMGIHTGEALVRSGGYVGHDVHRAKRVSDAGHGGQILVSQTTADLVRDLSSLVDLGPHRLKDLGEPQRIYQIGEGSFPPLRSLESFRHTLPRQRKSFIGREQEIAKVTEFLKDNQLVTIHGVGGCGKTRLAVQVGAELINEYPDGVFFADLAPVTDNDAIVPAIADAVGFPMTGSVGTLQTTASDEQVLLYLSGRTCLLILDNCEHLLDGCAEIADRLLSRCPHVSVLATSRESLQVDGEQAWRLPSLTLPENEAGISESEAVSLFVARARAASSGFELTPLDAPAVAEICRRLDGIPLAIEFAAARVTHLSPKQIAQKLDDRFQLLTGGRRQVQRQITLQAALDWSYDLLEEPEQILLRRLAVFPADFSLEAAEGICSSGDLEASSVSRHLGSLVAKSLAGTEPWRDVVRYRLLETVRAYAADRLAIAGEAQHMRDRMTDWFLDWLREPSWDESFGYGTIQRAVVEAVNIRAAIDWADVKGDIDALAHMASRVITISAVTSFRDEVQEWCRKALDAQIDLDPTVRAACRLGSFLGSANFDPAHVATLNEILDIEGVDPAMRALARSQRGVRNGIIGSFARDDALIADAREDLRVARALAAPLRSDFCLVIEVSDAMNELDLLNIDGAIAALRQALHRYEEVPELVGDTGRLALTYYLGAAYYAAGDHARATEMMWEASEAGRATGIDVADLRIFFGGGAPALAVSDRTAAVELLTSNLREVRRAQLPLGVEDWVSGAAGVITLDGEYQRAARLLSWVRSRTIDMGLPSTTPAQYVVNRYNTRVIREALGHDEAQRCREEGRKLSEDEAIELALEGLVAR